MAAMADAGITSSSDGSSGSGYDTDAAANYDSSSSEGTRVNDNTQTSGRRSWLMLIIAAAVATTFLALWVWKKRVSFFGSLVGFHGTVVAYLWIHWLTFCFS